MVPPLDKDVADVITGSEDIIKRFAEKHSSSATAIVDLIKDVLKNPAFNSDEVDTDMLRRLQASIESGDLEIISMRVEGDGAQNPELFKLPAEKVLRELLGDVRLAGHQHVSFHKDTRGNRIFAGYANGSVLFRLAQVRIGPNMVPDASCFNCYLHWLHLNQERHPTPTCIQ